MSRKKLTDARKVERITSALLNISADITSSKKTAEVLTIVSRDIALCIAIALSDIDDDMIITRKWIELEHAMETQRASFNGYIQTNLFDAIEANEDVKPADKKTTR